MPPRRGPASGRQLRARDINAGLFWTKVGSRDGATGCRIWLAGKDAQGYGCVNVGRRKVHAHRIAWALFHGSVQARDLVCHRCDVPSCVEPTHLFLGTPAANTIDSVMKGRAACLRRGEAHPGARLSDKDVAEIVRLYGLGVYAKVIASRFGVSTGTIYAIAGGSSRSAVKTPWGGEPTSREWSGAAVCRRLGVSPRWLWKIQKLGLFSRRRNYSTDDVVMLSQLRLERQAAADARGSRNPCAKLCERDVLDIRASAGIPVSDLARRFGVTAESVRNVIRRRTWRDAGGKGAAA